MCLLCTVDGLTDRHKGRQPKPKPDFHPELFCSVEVAWAAGFFDGEGWTSVHTPPSTTGRRYLQVGVAQVDRRPLERFRAAVGRGSVTESRRCGQWRANGAEAARAMEILWPALSEPKREQFLAAYGGIE